MIFNCYWNVCFKVRSFGDVKAVNFAKEWRYHGESRLLNLTLIRNFIKIISIIIKKYILSIINIRNCILTNLIIFIRIILIIRIYILIIIIIRNYILIIIINRNVDLTIIIISSLILTIFIMIIRNYVMMMMIIITRNYILIANFLVMGLLPFCLLAILNYKLYTAIKVSAGGHMMEFLYWYCHA